MGSHTWPTLCRLHQNRSPFPRITFSISLISFVFLAIFSMLPRMSSRKIFCLWGVIVKKRIFDPPLRINKIHPRTPIFFFLLFNCCQSNRGQRLSQNPFFIWRAANPAIVLDLKYNCWQRRTLSDCSLSAVDLNYARKALMQIAYAAETSSTAFQFDESYGLMYFKQLCQSQSEGSHRQINDFSLLTNLRSMHRHFSL